MLLKAELHESIQPGLCLFATAFPNYYHTYKYSKIVNMGNSKVRIYHELWFSISDYSVPSLRRIGSLAGYHREPLIWPINLHGRQEYSKGFLASLFSYIARVLSILQRQTISIGTPVLEDYLRRDAVLGQSWLHVLFYDTTFVSQQKLLGVKIGFDLDVPLFRFRHFRFSLERLAWGCKEILDFNQHFSFAIYSNYAFGSKR